MALPVLKPVLYTACVAPLEDDRLYAAAYAASTPGRRQKADRFHFAKDRRLSLAAELLLRHGLREAGLETFPAEFSCGAHEKPYLKEQGICFNLSHSGEWAACAVAGCEVGCDIEEIGPVNLKIARRFFFRSEYNDIFAQSTEEKKTDLFFRYWTLKESFMKATGLGMHLPLNEFQIVRGEPITVAQSVDERDYSFKEFREIPGYGCAICTAGDCSGAELKVLDLKNLLQNEVNI